MLGDGNGKTVACANLYRLRDLINRLTFFVIA